MHASGSTTTRTPGRQAHDTPPESRAELATPGRRWPARDGASGARYFDNAWGAAELDRMLAQTHL